MEGEIGSERVAKYMYTLPNKRLSQNGLLKGKGDQNVKNCLHGLWMTPMYTLGDKMISSKVFYGFIAANIETKPL